jgi:hypothetical protein
MQFKLTPQQAAKVAAKKKRHESIKLDSEWFFVSEFGVMAILNNEIDLETANLLLLGARKVRYKNLVDTTVSMQVGVASAMSKKPKEVFKKGTASFVKEAQV